MGKLDIATLNKLKAAKAKPGAKAPPAKAAKGKAPAMQTKPTNKPATPAAKMAPKAPKFSDDEAHLHTSKHFQD